MALHSSTFEYLKPTQEQLRSMAYVRSAFAQFVDDISSHLPEGRDKDYVLRQLRDCAMWANVTITRTADGTPRT